jgi:SAM-dependent methyltransferase
VEGHFDFIMFHHSLEHLSNPHEALLHVARLLSNGGKCLVRIPTVSSDAFDCFGKDWVQLDPPRHYFIPSRKGMEILGARSGLTLDHVTDDSAGWGYYASEQYQRDIPLNAQKALSVMAAKSFDDRAKLANEQSRGDQAAFLYYRTGHRS